MVSICKGICDDLSTVKKQVNGGPRPPGYKKCTTCAMIIDTEDLRCPCCKNKLRVGVRNWKSPSRVNRTKEVNIP